MQRISECFVLASLLGLAIVSGPVSANETVDETSGLIEQDLFAAGDAGPAGCDLVLESR